MRTPGHDRSRRVAAAERATRSRALNEQTCRIICPIAAGMTGVCLTGISVLRIAITVSRKSTFADDLLAIDSLLFLAATLLAYFALRAPSDARVHRLERLADAAFIAAMVLLTGVCFVITYAIGS